MDASEKAFTAVAYFRIVNPGRENKASISFVASTTRCAPLKYMTIPRKELQAAVLGARLKEVIIESHTLNISKTIFWTDSTTVISWIQSQHRKY